MEFVKGKTLHSAMAWTDRGRFFPLQRESKLVIAELAARALEYITQFGLIHRDFRTTNIIINFQRGGGQMRFIDLGHTIAALVAQKQHRSSVVKCNWKESADPRSGMFCLKHGRGRRKSSVLLLTSPRNRSASRDKCLEDRRHPVRWSVPDEVEIVDDGEWSAETSGT